MTGAVAANFHEGSRSEYLAQYVFASVGTVAPILHQEDYGLDLHCTITERLGQRAWVRDYYTIQVKSTMDSWVFETPESVKWLVEHPSPLFLCIVDKNHGRLAVYHTSPRFYAWSLPPLPDRMELKPSREMVGTCTQWEGGTFFSLSAPILEFSITDMLQDDFCERVREVLLFWIEVDKGNLTRMRTGLREFEMPHEYRTNETGSRSRVIQGIRMAEEPELAQARLQITKSVSWFSHQLFNNGDFGGAVRGMLFLRYLDRDNISGQLGRACKELNSKLKNTSSNYLYAGLDELGDMIDGKLSNE